MDVFGFSASDPFLLLVDVEPRFNICRAFSAADTGLMAERGVRPDSGQRAQLKGVTGADSGGLFYSSASNASESSHLFARIVIYLFEIIDLLQTFFKVS